MIKQTLPSSSVAPAVRVTTRATHPRDRNVIFLFYIFHIASKTSTVGNKKPKRMGNLFCFHANFFFLKCPTDSYSNIVNIPPLFIPNFQSRLLQNPYLCLLWEKYSLKITCTHYDEKKLFDTQLLNIFRRGRGKTISSHLCIYYSNTQRHG